MNKVVVIFSVVVASIYSVAALSKVDHSSPTFVYKTASACVDKVMKKSKTVPGKTTLASIPYASVLSVKLGGGAYQNIRTKYIPYIESSSIDKGTPGSAWKKCMLNHGAPVPKYEKGDGGN